MITLLVNKDLATLDWEHIGPMTMESVKEMYTWTLKMSHLSVFVVVTVFSMIPAGLLSIIRDPQDLEGQHLAQRTSLLPHRLKRGWIWKELFVPEEDPTSRVIGQVKLHIECRPCP